MIALPPAAAAIVDGFASSFAAAIADAQDATGAETTDESRRLLAALVVAMTDALVRELASKIRGLDAVAFRERVIGALCTGDAS